MDCRVALCLPEPNRRYDEHVDEPIDEAEWERIFGPVRHLRYATGPATLSDEYLELLRRVEDLPQNQSGTDKTWVESSLREYVEHYSGVTARPS